MSRLSILTICLLSAHSMAAAGPLSLFKKSPKPDPAQQVPALLNTLKSDSSESKRQQAAEDLRNFDLLAFPGIISGLIDALDNDSSSSVRREAAQSIGKMRPVSPQAHEAIKRASTKDESIRVRAEAKTVLLDWTIRRVQASGPTVAPPAQASEPPIRNDQNSRPLVAPPTPPAQTDQPPTRNVQTSRPPVALPTQPARPTRTTQTGEPPLAEPVPAVPTQNTKPEVRPRQDGPSLNAPN